MGIGTTTPDGTLHVHTGSAGTVTAEGAADNLVVESSGDAGISILTPDANFGKLTFGSPTKNEGAIVRYNQASTTMTIGTEIASGLLQFRTGGGVEAMRIESSGVVKATTKGNTNSTGGTFMMGNQNNNAEKWGVLTSSQYDSDSEPEGFALISGISFDSGGINNLIRIGGGVSETNAAGSIEFYTGATASTRLGTVSATINVNGLSFPNGKGIDFSASAGGGASSSLLDDYEEGTFTPSYATSGFSGTYGNQIGGYTKIGRMVNIVIQIDTTAISNAGSGNIIITGFPFASAGFPHRMTIQTSAIDLDETSYNWYGYFASSTTLQILYQKDNIGWYPATTSNTVLAGATAISITGTYYV